MKRTLALLALAALASVGLAAGLVTNEVAAGDGPAAKVEGPNGEHQVVVCKYVGTPGADERLQTGNNPIVVDSHALEGQGFTGAFPFDFSDQQGHSKAIRWASGPHDGDLAECPGQPPLTEITASAPAFQDPTCDVGAAVDLPTDEGVTYTVEGTVGPGLPVTVRATAEDGYVLVGTDAWTHTFGDVPDTCGPPPPTAIEVTPGVTFRDPTCELGAAVVPATTTGVTYAVQGTVAPGEKVTVSASADDGYTIRGPNRWEHTFGQVPTNCLAPPTEPVTPPTEPVTTPTAPPTPTAPLTPPTTPTPKGVTQKQKQTKPTASPPTAKAVAGVTREQQPTLAYTP